MRPRFAFALPLLILPFAAAAIVAATGQTIWLAAGLAAVGLAQALLALRYQQHFRDNISAEERLKNQSEALRNLSRLECMIEGDTAGALRAVTSAAATVLRVGRASVWLLDETESKLVCRDLFVPAKREHTSGMVLDLAACKSYFVPLMRDDIIDAHDALSDPRTSALQDYMKAEGIGAMLDAPIRVAGRVVGVLCHEHLGGPRKWHDEECGFARALSQQVSLALQAEVNHQARRSLQASEQRFRDIAQAVSVPLLISRVKDGRILFGNHVTQQVLGHDLEELRNHNVTDFYADPSERQIVLERLQKTGQVSDVEIGVNTARGVRRAIVTARLMELEGERCVISTLYDVTERFEAEQALRANESLLRQTGRLARVGGWKMDLVNNKLAWTDELFQMHDLDPTAVPEMTVEQSMRFCAPEHHEAMQKEVADAIAQKRQMDIEYAMISATGRKRWCRVLGEPEFKNGQLISLSGAVQDITDRREIEEQLRHAVAHAEEATRMKGEFLANMSHEIRTPLNGILGMTSVLNETALTAAQRDCMETIRNSGDALLTVVNDVLDYSKIEAGRMDISNVQFDLRQVLEESLDIVADRGHEKGLQLTLLGAPNLPRVVNGDPGRLRQILLNLLSNAVKFTDDGHVHVSASPDPARPDSIRFQVEDTGIGMLPEVQSRIFEPFMQADSSTTRRFGGTGLGLPISRRLVQIMGGEIGLASEAGKGTTFWFTVPLREAQVEGPRATDSNRRLLQSRKALVVSPRTHTAKVLAAQLSDAGLQVAVAASQAEALEIATGCQIVLVDGESAEHAISTARSLQDLPNGPRVAVLCTRRERPEVEARGMAAVVKPVRLNTLLETSVSLLSQEDGAAPTRRMSAPDQPALGARVLVAEDNLVNQKVVRVMLERLGCTAEVVPTGKAAVTAAAAGNFDAILMDCQMPEMDGYEATRMIRAAEADGKRIPIIALTAGAMQGERERCLEAGMDDFMTKPVHIDTMAETLRRNVSARSVKSMEDNGALDLNRLRQMVGDDAELINELVQSFLETSHDGVASLDSAMATGDAAAIRLAAHSIKGSSANFGAARLNELAAQLENHARAGNLEHAPMLIEKLHFALEELDDFVKTRRLPKRPPASAGAVR